MHALTSLLPAAGMVGTAGRAAPTSNGRGAGEEEVGHEVDLPAEVLLDSATVLSDHYAEVAGAHACACWGSAFSAGCGPGVNHDK